MSEKLVVSQPNAIIISIYDVLSPFKRHLASLEEHFEAHLEHYVRTNSKDKRIVRIVKRIRKEEPVEACQMGRRSVFEDGDTEDAVLGKVVAYILSKSRQPNRPYTPVSLVKDWLWADHLTSGELKSIVYDYVPELLEHWRMKLFIKLFSISEADSSGQKLFFKSTQYGDLTRFFNNYIQYFKESKSDKEFYRNIANLLRDSASNLLYITNEFNDALAAHQAGFKCVVIKEKPDRADRSHDGIRFTSTIENIEFVADPNRPVDCC